MKLNIQLFAEGTFNGSSTTSNGKIRVVWNSTSSDAVANKSSVYAKVQVARTFTGDATRGTFSGTITINGTSTSVSKKITMTSKDWYTIGETTIDVPHNEDGTKVCNISARLTQSGTSLAGTYTASQDVQLDTIARASAFNNFTMSVNNDSSILVVASITKRNDNFVDTLNICNENITLNNGTNYITFSRNEHLTAYNRFYQLMGNETQANYTAVLTTSNSGTQIGNTSALTAYNVALPNYAISVGTITSSDDNANNYIRSGSTHKVSDFTSTNTYLQGFSNPRLSYSLGATYNTLYGNAINISGATTRSGLSLGNDSFTLGTNFTGGTKTLNASDGRKTASNSITLTRKDWSTPSVSITLTRESATGTQINWQVSWSYTSGSGNLTSKLNATYTYNGTTTSLIYDRSLTQTSGSLSGNFQLANADDYKYPITASATLTDTIDYQVQGNTQIPGGLPAIYVHKDSSSNNLVDINGTIEVNGTPTMLADAGGTLYIGANNSSLALRPKGVNTWQGQTYFKTDGSMEQDTGDKYFTSGYDGASNWQFRTDANGYTFNKGLDVPSIYTRGNIDTAGSDLVLGAWSGTNDSGDIIWKYGNGNEKTRIWTENNPTGLDWAPKVRTLNEQGQTTKEARILTDGFIGLTDQDILTLPPGFYSREDSSGWTDHNWPTNTWHCNLWVLGDMYGSNGWKNLICFDCSNNELWIRSQQWGGWSSWKKIG